MLSDRYRNQGFELSDFGASSTALRRFNKVIYVFNPGIQENPIFIDALCDCHLKNLRKKYARPEVLKYCSLSLAGLSA